MPEPLGLNYTHRLLQSLLAHISDCEQLGNLSRGHIRHGFNRAIPHETSCEFVLTKNRLRFLIDLYSRCIVYVEIKVTLFRLGWDRRCGTLRPYAQIRFFTNTLPRTEVPTAHHVNRL